jgi:hypothetical protein
LSRYFPKEYKIHEKLPWNWLKSQLLVYLLCSGVSDQRLKFLTKFLTKMQSSVDFSDVSSNWILVSVTFGTLWTFCFSISHLNVTSVD